MGGKVVVNVGTGLLSGRLRAAATATLVRHVELDVQIRGPTTGGGVEHAADWIRPGSSVGFFVDVFPRHSQVLRRGAATGLGGCCWPPPGTTSEVELDYFHDLPTKAILHSSTVRCI